MAELTKDWHVAGMPHRNCTLTSRSICKTYMIKHFMSVLNLTQLILSFDVTLPSFGIRWWARLGVLFITRLVVNRTFFVDATEYARGGASSWRKAVQVEGPTGC